MPQAPFPRRRVPRVALIAWRVTLLLDRVSRRLFTPPARMPTSRFQHAERPSRLTLERPLHAALRPPREYVFIPEDEYFEAVERVLESV